MLLLGSIGELGILSVSPGRDIVGVDIGMVVQELLPNEFGCFRCPDRNTEKTLSKFFSGGRITVLSGFRIRRIFWNRMNEPKSGIVVKGNDALGVAHGEAKT